MTITTTAPASPLDVARSRWDEASRVTAAYKIVKARRTDRAWKLTGQAGELQAWADVAAAEAQLVEAEAAEVRAWEDVAWQEKAEADARLVKRLRVNGGR